MSISLIDSIQYSAITCIAIVSLKLFDFILQTIDMSYCWLKNHWLKGTQMLDALFLSPFGNGLRSVFKYRLGNTSKDDIEELNGVSLASRLGISLTIHHVTTQDGYILKLFRCTKVSLTYHFQSPNILIMHGFMQDADSFLVSTSSTDENLVQQLVNLGYVVWLGNNRGNYYSQAHESLNTSSYEYWRFTIDHLAKYDVPAFIGYILSHSNVTKIGYIGYSQGTTQFFACLSTFHPHLCDMISIFIAMAPVVQFEHYQTNSIFQYIPPTTVQLIYGNKMIKSVFGNSRRILSEKFYSHFISYVLSTLIGWKCTNISSSRRIHLFQSVYSPTAVMMAEHWTKIMHVGYISSFNMELIDSNTTITKTYQNRAIFDISNIRCPVALLVGERDEWFNHQTDSIAKQLPNCVFHEVIPNYEHLELLWGDDSSKLVFPKVIQLLKKHMI